MTSRRKQTETDAEHPPLKPGDRESPAPRAGMGNDEIGDQAPQLVDCPVDPSDLTDPSLLGPLSLFEMRSTQGVVREVVDYFCGRAPELAGILFGPTNEPYLVTHFVPDANGVGSPASFQLDAAHLNAVIKKLKPAGLSCHGIVHSHPAGIPQPSWGDVRYLRRLFAHPANGQTSHVFVPIVCDRRLSAFVFTQNQIFPANLTLV